MSTSTTIVGSLAVELGMSDEQFRATLASAQVQAEATAAKMRQKANVESKAAEAQVEAVSVSVRAAGEKVTRDAEAQVVAASRRIAEKAKPEIDSNSKIANRSLGLLNISRAIDDAQYGFRGVVNNIEGIALGLGLGTGVAASATLAAVAINMMIDPLDRAYQATRKLFDGFQDGAERAKESVAGIMGGGFGSQAIAKALREQAEFLMGRSDRTDYNLQPGRGGYVSGQAGYAAAVANNLRRSIEASALMQQAFRAAADASKELAAAQRGAAAQYDLTTKQQEMVSINRQVFQAAVDKYNGGDNLRTKITQEARREGMIRSDAEKLYGRFAEGNGPATDQVVRLLSLQKEKNDALNKQADAFFEKGFEWLERDIRETNAFFERGFEWLERDIKETDAFFEKGFEWLERDTRETNAFFEKGFDWLERDMRETDIFFERGFDWLRKSLAEEAEMEKRRKSLIDRRDSLLNSMSRSEIVGISDVFSRNLNAGMKSEELKQLEEINQGIKELKPAGLG